jgi:hypothetical protein
VPDVPLVPLSLDMLFVPPAVVPVPPADVPREVDPRVVVLRALLLVPLARVVELVLPPFGLDALEPAPLAPLAAPLVPPVPPVSPVVPPVAPAPVPAPVAPVPPLVPPAPAPVWAYATDIAVANTARTVKPLTDPRITFSCPLK